MTIRSLAGAVAIIFAAFPSAPRALEAWDPFTIPYRIPDLEFPAEPQPFSTGIESLMFKPEGNGPFPGVVIMPTCSGHTRSKHAFDWAKRTLDRGYVVLVIDPLGPRGVTNNCTMPRPVPISRLLKDAFDGANHLRQQPFIDANRVALLGLSLGGMVGLGASGSKYSRLDGNEPFRAIVSLYPACIDEYAKPVWAPRVPVDVHYMPDRVVVPLFLEIGDKDPSFDEPLHGCKKMSDEQRFWERRLNMSFILPRTPGISRSSSREANSGGTPSVNPPCSSTVPK